MKITKAAVISVKIKDLDRLSIELNCASIKQQIINKLNACTSLKEANEFDTVAEILKVKNTLKFQKQEKIEILRTKISEEIYEVYPQHSQINTSLGLDEEDKQKMLEFIKQKRDEYKVLKNRILNCDSIEKLKNMNI